jgi:glutamine---fructose-6-phosphate transaminase (isomerizing)
MGQEIDEIPQVVERILADGEADASAVAKAVRSFRPRRVTVVARGTSDNAAVYARYLIETHLHLPVALAAPSVTTIYRARLAWHDTLVICVSQSGQSPDIVAVAAAARQGGALTVSITNDRSSPLAEVSQHTLLCHAGPERAVAATKTYVAELAVLAHLVARLVPRSALAHGLPAIPGALRMSVHRGDEWLSRATEALASTDHLLVVSRGFNLATALEVALKFKETGHIFAEGYSTADLLHGPIALAAPDVPLVAFRPHGRIGRTIDEALRSVHATGARTWLVRSEARPRRTISNEELRLSIALPEPLTPLVLVVPGQRLAEAVARRRGYDPDSPIGLTKVTRTF